MKTHTQPPPAYPTHNAHPSPPKHDLASILNSYQSRLHSLLPLTSAYVKENACDFHEFDGL